MRAQKSREINASPLETIASAVDVALYDPQPRNRMEARAYLRAVEPFELVLIAARQGA